MIEKEAKANPRQEPSTDKTGLGYTGEVSSSGEPRREMKFVEECREAQD